MTDRRVEVFVRGFAPVRSGHLATVERLEELQRSGKISGYTVTTWPNRVRLSERAICGDVIGIYDRFAAWADAHGRRIIPPFDVHETGFLPYDEPDEVLVLPDVCLAVYEEDELVGVYPSADETRLHTVASGLEALAGS